MNRLFKFVIFLAFFGGFQSIAHSGVVESGATVYIAPMNNGLNTFISAEMLKQKVPLVITTQESKAAYILTGSSLDKGSNAKWYDVAFGTAGTRDSVQASVTLVRVKDKSVVWAGSAGDRSVVFGVLKRGGERKAALRVVRGLKKDLF